MPGWYFLLTRDCCKLLASFSLRVQRVTLFSLRASTVANAVPQLPDPNTSAFMHLQLRGIVKLVNVLMPLELFRFKKINGQVQGEALHMRSSTKKNECAKGRECFHG